jgi:hypothetical protein
MVVDVKWKHEGKRLRAFSCDRKRARREETEDRMGLGWKTK